MRTAPLFLSTLLLVLALAGASCSDGITSPPTTPQHALPADDLERAYAARSQSLLNQYFGDWADLIPAFSSAQVAAFSDTVRHVYRVFEAFYSPTDLNRLTNGRHENFETAFRYVVVQNTIDAAVVDTNPRYYFHRGVESAEIHIDDFRPPLQHLDLPAVYLSAEADSIIYDFLYENDGSPEADHADRVAFLREAIQLTHHHWVADYHKTTMPAAAHIYLDESFDRALVTFRVFYQFGSAYFERRNDVWTLVSSELTAIE